MHTPIWKDIPGYEGLYQASISGQIKSLHYRKERIINQHFQRDGYLRVILTRNTHRQSFYVHRLVASAFLGVSDLMVNHIDSNKSNNLLRNLEYVDRRGNLNHYYLTTKKSSKYSGVCFDKAKNRWTAYITFNYKRHFLGYFDTEEEASKVYLSIKSEEDLKPINARKKPRRSWTITDMKEVHRLRNMNVKWVDIAQQFNCYYKNIRSYYSKYKIKTSL